MGNVGIVQLGLWLCGPQPMPAAAGKLWEAELLNSCGRQQSDDAFKKGLGTFHNVVRGV